MKTVKVPAGYALGRRVDETTVTLLEADNGKHVVLLEGARIGYVWKGTRRYSPPAWNGSRIVKYHKQVPEWQAGKDSYNPQHHRDTRTEVLRELVAAQHDCAHEDSENAR